MSLAHPLSQIFFAIGSVPLIDTFLESFCTDIGARILFLIRFDRLTDAVAAFHDQTAIARVLYLVKARLYIGSHAFAGTARR